MIRQGLIELFFDAASIQRWNDFVRPVQFTELDKQAHKAIIAFILAKFEAHEKGIGIDWNKLIQGGMFEFLHRVLLTDIKPSVFHRMMKQKGKELNEWVYKKIEPLLSDIDCKFLENFKLYFDSDEYSKYEKRILKASHYLASNWEFKIIYQACPDIYGIEKTKEEIENEIEDHFDIIGVQKIWLGKKTFGFVDLCGQLRFQKRWAQSPRIPETSVLGHMLTVAFLSYLCSIEIKASAKRMYNNFYCGLFHDLAEILTRDIISPIKKSVEGLEKIIEEYEKIQVEQKILPLLPPKWHSEIKYFIDDPFENKIIDNGEIKIISEKNMENFNDDMYSPVDGRIIRACDHLAAFIEASSSMNHGIKSRHLSDGYNDLYETYRNCVISNIDFGMLFDFFKSSKVSTHP